MLSKKGIISSCQHISGHGLVLFTTTRKQRNAINELIKDSLNDYEMPSDIIFLDSLPMNNNGLSSICRWSI